MSGIAPQVASALYGSGCLKFGSFKIKSGAFSPYYIDLARLLSAPRELCLIAETAADEIRRIMALGRVDKLASIELKGALILPSIGCRLNMPCVVVRKEDKAYGVTGRTAGADVIKGEKVLFFDDVISEGLSKIEGIRPLEQLGAKVEHMVVVVDREQGGKQKLEQAGYKVHSLSTVSELVFSLSQLGSISRQQANLVLEYVRSQFERS